MAKQPTIEQIDQLISDLDKTAQHSYFTSIRLAANETMQAAISLRIQLVKYNELTR